MMATHDLTIVDQMRKRVIELENGHVVRDQSRAASTATSTAAALTRRPRPTLRTDEVECA